MSGDTTHDEDEARPSTWGTRASEFGWSVASDTTGSLVAGALGAGALKLLGVLDISAGQAWLAVGALLMAAALLSLVVVSGRAIADGTLIGVGQLGAAAEGLRGRRGRQE